jgi:putative ABC transport system permease protein
MIFADLVQISVSALLKHKLRSLLTLLGIVIGILSVSAIASVIQGIDQYMADLLGSIGSQGFVVSRMGLQTSEEGYLKALKRRKIPASFAEIIKRECPSVSHASPEVYAGSEVKSGRKSASDVMIEGTTEDAQYTSEFGIEDGRFFSPYEVQHGRAVCVIGADVAEELFTTPDVLDKILYIKGHRFRVIGVHEKMGTVLGMSRDSFVRIPYTSFEKIYGGGQSANISVRANSPDEVPQAMEEVRATMRRLRKLRPGDEDDFGLLTSEALMELWRNLSTTAFLASIGVASIALLVGGIGIMNIMFVSVKERTGEIGLRKATGAKRRDILLQFLTESSILCLFGGALGVGIGLGAAAVLSHATKLPMATEWWAIAAALAVSVGVGVFFGVYPAIKASSMAPVNALRYGK